MSLSKELLRLYSQTGLKSDLFGRRPALPTEIARIINEGNFQDLEGHYPPTPEDIAVKDQNLQIKQNKRKLP